MEAATTPEIEFNDDLEPEVQTDKQMTKQIPCRECGRRLTVSTFYVPANARCSVCRGEGKGASQVGVPVPGVTDPARAKNLEGCLINPQFAKALCPLHPDDPEHGMELKHVSHHDRFGPSEIVGYDRGGRPEIRQLDRGEVALLQCTHASCKATVTYSTTAQVHFGVQNAPTTGKHNNAWIEVLGAREGAEDV